MPIPQLPASIDLAPIAAWLTTADREALQNAVIRLTTRVNTLECERSALEFAATSFGSLAARLNTALRDLREAPPA